MYIPSYLKSALMPTIAQARAAMEKADIDLPNRYTYDLMSCEMRLMTVDSRIRNCVRTRKTAVTSYSWDIVAADKKDADKAMEAKQRLKGIISGILKYHTDTPLFGAMVLELDWGGLDNPAGFVPRISKRFQPVEIVWSDNVDTLLLAPNGDSTKAISIDESLRSRFIIDIDESFAPGGILRALLIDAILKKDNLQEWANYNSQLKGLLQFIVSDSTDADNISAAQNALTDLAKKKFAITDKDTEVKLIELAASGSNASFKDLIEKIDANIAIAILGQANTSELPDRGGSRAATEIQRLISADIAFDDMQRIEDLINNQLLNYDYDLTYGGKGGAPWNFSFVYSEDVDIETRMNAASIAIQSGIPIMAKEVYAMTGFTQPEGFPEILNEKANDPNFEPEATNGGF